MNTILLRFRDTEKEIDTINEHLKLIDDKGFTWWGWWKKSEEDNNELSLSELKNRVQNKKIDKIGLFDRTTSRFFVAQIIAVKYNFNVKINSPKKENTPSYYNDIKLHCWFKLCSISMISEEDFIKLFNIIPTKEETLYILPYIEEPIDERIEIDSCNILHLSDIHFGDDFGFPHASSIKEGTTLLDRLKNYFAFINKIKIGLVIVSGDITSRANIGVLQGPASEFLKNLCEILQIKKEQLVIVPGNHDIPIKDANFYDYTHENAFKLFLRDFYDKKKEITGYEKFITSNGLKIDILRINSARLRNKAMINFGYVGWDDYRYLVEENINDDSNSIKIAVLHHHLIPVPTEEPINSDYPYGNISVTLDAGKVIEGLQHYNFNIVLHGHQHLPGLNRVSRGIKNGTTVNLHKGLFLLGAGSAGAKVERLSGYLRDNSFSILRLGDEKISIETLQYNSTREPSTFFDSEINIVR